MNILYLVILLPLCYQDSHCNELPQKSALHSKAKFVPNVNDLSIDNLSMTQQRAKRHSDGDKNQTETRATKTKRRKKYRAGTAPKNLNITEIIGYLNENNDSGVKVLDPKVSGHFNDLGRSIIKQNGADDDVMVNLKDLHENVERFGCGIDNGDCSQFCSETNEIRCSCFKGFLLGSDNKSCIEVNECVNGANRCSHLCINTHGSYRCACPRGLRLHDDQITCVDVNECLLRNGHGPCQDACANIVGSYRCSCSLRGTRLSANRHTCEDINECAEGTSGCSHGCINVIRGAFCTCPPGMELEEDFKTCKRVRKREVILDFMEQDDQLTGSYCPLLIAPANGFFYCSQKTSGYSNREDSLCQLVCPSGYKTIGDYKVVCDPDGTWSGPTTGKCHALADRNFNPLKNYIDFIWDYPKPKIVCSASRLLYVTKEEKLAYVSFPIPKTNVDWSNVESYPPEIKASLEAYLPQGHHWIVFKATHPETKLSAKCIISIIVKRQIEGN